MKIKEVGDLLKAFNKDFGEEGKGEILKKIEKFLVNRVLRLEN